MSETIELEDDTTARRPRAPRERGMTEGTETDDILVGDETTGTVDASVEEALAEAQRGIVERDRQLAAERDARSRAEREAQRAHAGRQQDRGAAIAATIEAATTAQANAESAKRAAREAGDIDAEIKADKALAQATYRLEQAQAFAAQAQRDPVSQAGATQEPQQGAVVSGAAAKWIAAHPRFNTDPDYKGKLMAAHYDLLNDGVQPDSRAYFRELDRVAAELEGRKVEQPQQRPAPDQFSGAPPAKGSVAASGGNTIKTAFGPVTVVGRGKDVTYRVRPEDLPDFQEGAKINGMSLKQYVAEQIASVKSNYAGLMTEEGRQYR